MIKPIHVIIAIVVVAAIVLAFNWKNWFGPPEPTEYDKCVTANKAKADGDACTNCTKDSKTRPFIFQGIIKDGVCIKKPDEKPKVYAISAGGGAVAYSFDGTKFTPSNSKVDEGVRIKILDLSPDKKFVNTIAGWISVDDIKVIE